MWSTKPVRRLWPSLTFKCIILVIVSGSLLSTKLYIPPARANAVARPHLTEKLLAGVGRPGSFTLLSGPAGSGKTTLLSGFVIRLRRPVAWLSLDEGDNDPFRFWTHLIAACQSIVDGVGAAALELLSTPQALPEDTVPTSLINDLASQNRSVVLVLDDYHEIQNPAIHAGLLFLLDHLPDNLHLVVSTRTDPPWPLARYRARNQLLELRAQDLRFSLAETTEFLKHTMGLELSAADVTALAERTEGWVAGLQLAAIAMQSLVSMQGRSDIPAFIRAFTGSNVYIAEYLVEEILQRQPEEVQTFLLQTSLLERLNAGLCQAVTGCRDGQAKLTALQRANIFVIPLDDEGRWFRYHHLFADLLQARLRQTASAEEMTALHRRAAAWYEQNGFTVEAVEQFLAANDFDSVAALVEQAARAMIFTGRVNMLREWLEALPAESLDHHPRLTFYLFWIDLMQAKADLTDRAIQEQEDRLRALPSSPENDRLRGELMAVVCRAMVLSGRTARGIRLAHEALAHLSEENLASRASANSALAIAYGLEGRAEEAEPAYRACLPQAIAAGDYRLAAHTTMARALTQGHYGQLHEAARLFQTIIDMGDQAGVAQAKTAGASKIFFPAGQGYIGLAGIYLEWNDLETAESYLEQGLELCRRGGLDGIFIGRIFMSRLHQAKGDLEGALAEIQLAQQVFRRADDFQIADRQIRIRLARGDIDGAARWAGPWVKMLGIDKATRRPPLLFVEVIEAIVSRVFLAQGETGQALQLLEKLQATAGPGRRLARLIEVYLLRALAYQKQNQGHVSPEALECFEQAIELAEPEGYTLSFLEEGLAVIPLLNAVLNHQAAPDRLKEYARKLLDAFGEMGRPAAAWPPGESAGLVEPLTPREIEVLALIAAGDSNQTIADKLVITVRTVKKHTSNIIGKLNATNRTQAAARARELGLLPIDK